MDIGSTPSQTYENPVYNKRLQFNIESDNDVVRIQVLDEANQKLFIETRLTMKDLRDYMDDVTIEIKELWFAFDNPE